MSLLYLKGEGNPSSLETTFLGLCMSLYVGQVSWGGPGYSADMEGACGCHGEKGSQSVVGL